MLFAIWRYACGAGSGRQNGFVFELGRVSVRDGSSDNMLRRNVLYLLDLSDTDLLRVDGNAGDSVGTQDGSCN